jgi:diguanylate cyclase (GGDEF)-like protein
MNGSGPRAWKHHWLVVPLYDEEGGVIGVICADEPEDRLLPPTDRLQALRVFANQAATALAAARQFERVRFLADHDALTNLLNRRAFVRDLDAATARASRYGHSFALVLLDLDDFKGINDTLGHVAGDEALASVARTAATLLRRGDDAYRLGGDEFALILTEATVADAEAVVRRLSAALAAPDSAPYSLRASFGIATSARAGHDPKTLFRIADEAMYTAKRREESLHVAA